MLAFAQYLSALQELGHEVVYLEESGWDNSCYHPSTGSFDNDPGEGLARLRLLLESIQTLVQIHYFRRATAQLWSGSEICGSCNELEQVIGQADLLLNIGGVCALPEFELAPCRAMIDLDPLFTQVGKFAGDDIDIYHRHFTYGCNLGKSTCNIPTNGILWKPTVPPVNVSFWKNAASLIAAGSAYTTIANWSAYGDIEFDGEQYGQKDKEFTKLLELPGRTAANLELALAGANAATVDQFNSAGWSVRSPVGNSVPRNMPTLLHTAAGSVIAPSAILPVVDQWLFRIPESRIGWRLLTVSAFSKILILLLTRLSECREIMPDIRLQPKSWPTMFSVTQLY